MEAKVLKSVTSQVYKRFPEFAGCKPKVRQRNSAQPKSASNSSTYLLTFQSSARVTTSSGSKQIPRWVRVVVSDKGKILKVTTSR